MFKLIIAFLIVTLGCGGCYHEARSQVSPLPPTLMPVSVAKLDTGGGFCTAWKVGKTLVATAGHCCDEDSQFKLEGANSVPGSELKVLIDNDETDVCVLRGQMRGPVLALALVDPPIGAFVFTAGYPRGRFLMSMGLWSGRHEESSISSTVSNPGASGSPVMDDQGNVVALLNAYVPGMDSLTISTSLEDLRNAVNAARKII